MDRARTLEVIRDKRKMKSTSWQELAKVIGKSPTYTAATLHGQHRLSTEDAQKLAGVLELDAEMVKVLTDFPVREEFPLTTDPFKYRLMEIIGVYGDALREMMNELFGDGILSAIDCKVSFERSGERGIITIDAKFLLYKEF
jgi:cyanate lyase